MTDKIKLRRLNHLMAKHYTDPRYFDSWKKQTLEYVLNTNLSAWIITDYKEKLEIYKLANDLSIKDDKLKEIWFSTWWSKYQENKSDYRKKPQKEGRDNKDIHVGSGGSNCNKIRYPSKKRSIKTWKKFYKLFPSAAIEDGFDGKTSKRMK
jgi:hypothetical protein